MPEKQKIVNEEAAKATGTVLLIQSSQTECDQLTGPLSEFGYNVLSTTNYKEGLKFYRDRDPNIIILSAIISGGSSFEFCRHVRGDMKDDKTPIILTSSVFSGKFLVDARAKWGVNDVVLLPITLDKMFHLIQFHMGIDDTRPETSYRTDNTQAAKQKAKALAKKKLSLEGDLSEVKLEHLLRIMALNKKSGVLKLGAGEGEMELHIQNGKLVYVGSKYIEGLSLSEHLVENNLVPSDRIPALKKRMETEKKLMGQLLIEVGLIAKDMLNKSITDHIFKKAVHAFKMKGASYKLSKEDAPAQSDIAVQIDLAQVIFEGIRKSIDPMQFESNFEDLPGTVFSLLRDRGFDMKSLPLNLDEKRLAYAMDGKQTLAEIMGSTSLSPEEISRLIAALMALKIIRCKDKEIKA